MSHGLRGLYTGPIHLPHPAYPEVAVPFWFFPLDHMDCYVYAISDPATLEVVYIAEGSNPPLTTKTLLEGRKWMTQEPTPEFLAWGRSLEAGVALPMQILAAQPDYDRYYQRSGHIRDFWAAGAPLLNKLPRAVPPEERLDRLTKARFVALRGLADLLA